MSGQKLDKGADITPEQTEHLKAIALVLLMIHHLFGCKFIEDWMSFAKGADIMIGISGRICLALFLFCSGYGLYKSYVSKENAPRSYIPLKIVKTLIPYWLVMIIAIVILIFLGKFNPLYIPMNLVAWLHNDDMLYVSFSWYIKLQLLLLATLPIVRFIEKKWKKNLIIDYLFYVILPFVLWFFLRKYEREENFTDIFRSLVSTGVFLLSWYSLFALGMLYAKYGIYSKIRNFAERFPKVLVIILSVIICGYVIYVRYLIYHFYLEVCYYSITDSILMPFFAVSCLLIMDNVKFRSKYVIPFLGKNSIFYWLLSGMFFLNTKELMPVLTFPRYSLLIFLWLFVMLTPFVFACSFASDKILGLIIRKKKD